MLPLVSLCAAAAGGHRLPEEAAGGEHRLPEEEGARELLQLHHSLPCRLSPVRVRRQVMGDLSTMPGSNNSYWRLMDELVGTTFSTIVRALADAAADTRSRSRLLDRRSGQRPLLPCGAPRGARCSPRCKGPGGPPRVRQGALSFRGRGCGTWGPRVLVVSCQRLFKFSELCLSQVWGLRVNPMGK